MTDEGLMLFFFLTNAMKENRSYDELDKDEEKQWL